MTQEKGRGIFASKPIMKGELISVEKPIACGASTLIVAEELTELVQLKGIQALRLNQMYDGESKDLKIPSIEIFTRNNYRHM